MEYLTIRRLLLRYWDRLHFQIHQKLNHDILNLLDKSKTPDHSRFPLANPCFGESVYSCL